MIVANYWARFPSCRSPKKQKMIFLYISKAIYIDKMRQQFKSCMLNESKKSIVSSLEQFSHLKLQKRIVVATTIRGNTVPDTKIKKKRKLPNINQSFMYRGHKLQRQMLHVTYKIDQPFFYSVKHDLCKKDKKYAFSYRVHY